MRFPKAGIVAGAAVVAIATGAGVTHSAVADTSGQQTSVEVKRARAIVSGKMLQGTSDRDLLRLLFSGTGPVAEANPSVVQTLGFAANRAPVDEVALEKVISRYLKVQPEFASKYAPALRSGEAARVATGLDQFIKSMVVFYQNDSIFTETRKAVEKSLRDQARTEAGTAASKSKSNVNVTRGVNVAYGVNVVAAAAVLVGTVAGAVTLVVAIAAILVVYLDQSEVTDETKLAMADQKARIAVALAQ